MSTYKKELTSSTAPSSPAIFRVITALSVSNKSTSRTSTNDNGRVEVLLI
jgi:hypothetical protein